MRNYFASLGESAHPNSSDPRTRAITRFQELLLVAFREFSIITEDTIHSERKRFRSEIIHGIESFSKRAAIRNLHTLARFDKEQAGKVYDILYNAIYVEPPPPQALPVVTTSEETIERFETRIGLKTFRVFLSNIATWARDESIVSNGFQERVDRQLAEHELIDRLFYFWDFSRRGALSFQVGAWNPIYVIIFSDLMEAIEWFFNLHDKDKDGFMTKDEILQLSESLLFIFRHERGDGYLGAVSRFMTHTFEYGDEMIQQPTHPLNASGTPIDPAQIGTNQPYLNLATFRMVVLADELLESFFETDLAASFQLDAALESQSAQAKTGFLGGLLSTFVTDDNRKILNKLSDEIGKTVGKHQVTYRPSIGKARPLQEPESWEPLLAASSRSVRKSPSTPTLSRPSPSSSSTETSEIGLPAAKLPDLIQAANAAVKERPTFAIDEAKDDEDLEDTKAEDDADVMDEVDAFLQAHDSGLTETDKEVAKELLSASPMK
ncbi:hypothetical protein Clacol_005690 [Clathrus columnatus]|uniref:EF-hand domain-containing protein n=1 Tax=Clathrus columnatus TaxID=1419009 RepID=A0AAV5ACY0_9AGAM|nr:hypothetical protein Clacol_005690 [Clathrus columnatus]